MKTATIRNSLKILKMFIVAGMTSYILLAGFPHAASGLIISERPTCPAGNDENWKTEYHVNYSAFYNARDSNNCSSTIG